MYSSEQKKKKILFNIEENIYKNNKLIRHVAEQICKRNSTRLLVLFSNLLLQLTPALKQQKLTICKRLINIHFCFFCLVLRYAFTPF